MFIIFKVIRYIHIKVFCFLFTIVHQFHFTKLVFTKSGTFGGTKRILVGICLLPSALNCLSFTCDSFEVLIE